MKKFYTLLSLLITFTLSTNLTAQTCSDGSYQWSDMATIFESNGCASASCHGGGSGGLDLTTFDGFSSGGTKCGTEIFNGTNLVDIIEVGATCGDTGGGAGGTIGAMSNFTGMAISADDAAAIQAYIDEGAFEFCPGTPLDDGVCDPPTTIASLTAPAQNTLCNDGSDAVTFAAPAGSLPDVQIVVEVNGNLITITDDGSFDTSTLMEGDEVCYTAFNFDLAAINDLLTTAGQLCPILDCDATFGIPGVNQAIIDLLSGASGGGPGLDDLQEALDFAGSFGNPIGSVQTAGATLDALNAQIGALLGNVCYASSEAVCLGVVSCGGPNTCPTVYLNDDNLPSLPEALCVGDLLELCFDIAVDEAIFDANSIEFNYELLLAGNAATVDLTNSYSSGTAIDANATGQICFSATIPAGSNVCESFELSLEIESVFYRDADCPDDFVAYDLLLTSPLPLDQTGDNLNDLVPLLGIAGLNPILVQVYPTPDWTATVTQAPACDGSTLGIVEIYAGDGTLCDTVSDLGTAGVDGECPANNAELQEYTYEAFETFVVPDQNDMDSIVVNPCAINVVVPAQTIECMENCGPCEGDDVAVTFSVDMSCSGTDARPPVVTGPFNGFSGDGNIMIDPDGDDIWEAVICAIPGETFEYKYAIQDFVEQENLVDDAIGGASGVTCNLNTNFFDFSNRLITIPDNGGALDTDAYGFCGSCDNPPVNVTFSVDMNCSDVAPGTQVAMFGGFNDFCCPYNLSDTDGDNVWTTTLPFPTDDSGCISMQYLYMSPDFDNVESFLGVLSSDEIGECPTLISDYNEFANRVVEVCEDVVLDEYWQSCSAPAEPAAGCDDGDCANGEEIWDGCTCVAGDPPVDPGCDDGDCTNGVETWDGCECVAGTAPTPCEDDADCSNGFEVWNTSTCNCDIEDPILGCTNDTAVNYDANATCDDDSCDFTCPDPGTCDDGDCANGEEVWDGDLCECVAGTTPTDPGCDDGDCTNGLETWDGCECVAGTAPTPCEDDADCSNGFEVWNTSTCNCDIEDPILGCTNDTAVNYDANATCDDDSCDFTCPDPGTCDDADCANGEEVWDGDLCECVQGTPQTDPGCDDGDCTNGLEVYNEATCLCEPGTPPSCPGGETLNDMCECVTILTCEDPCAPNFEAEGACDDYDMTCPEDTCFEFYTWDTETCECIVAVVDFNCDDENECTNDFVDETTCECVNETIPNCGEVEGCTDACAPNFNSEATLDDGSCEDYDMTCPEDACLEIYTWDSESCTCTVASYATPDCDDMDECTNDSYDDIICECINEAIPNCGEQSCPTPGIIEDCGFELSQQRLNAIATFVASETGGTFPHGGMDLTADQTIRDIFTSDGNVGDEINPGFVVTKHTYAKDSSGNKGDLLATFVMLKHEEGYWEDSNDWEYIMIPVDPTVDYTVNPNGILANAAVSGNVHEMNPGCVGCHNGAGGGDQLFSND